MLVTEPVDLRSTHQPMPIRHPFHPPAGAFHELSIREIRNPESLQFEGKISESIPIFSDFKGAGCHPNSESIPDFTGEVSAWEIRNPEFLQFEGKFGQSGSDNSDLAGQK